MGTGGVGVVRGSDGFEEFAAANLTRLLRFGLVLTGDAQQAQDLVQSALVKALAKWPQIDRERNPAGYVQQTMVRLQTDAWRRLTRRQVPLEAAAVGVGDMAAATADRLDVLSLLRVLPQRQRAVIVLRFYEDMSEQDAARVLGCSVGTVKSQTHKALRSLRARLNEQGSLPTGVLR
jgi:RNA polymerase sigma-70 factor (sigma-E family)